MKNSVKSLLVFIIILISVLLTASCGNGENNDGQPPHMHSSVTDERAEPTCTESGLTEGSHCADCGEVLKKQDIIPALGHTESDTYSYDAMGHYKACADCQALMTPVEAHSCADGVCSVCGYTENKECRHINKSWVITSEPTCVAEGIKEEVCDGCGASFNSESIDKIAHIPDEEFSVDGDGHWKFCIECKGAATEKEAHSFINGVCLCGYIEDCTHGNKSWVTVQLPACNKEGIKQEKCDACGSIFNTESIEKLAHTPENTEATEPTCTEDGLTAGVKCSVCGEIITAQQTVPAKGHTETAIDEEREATCTADGLTAGVKCSVCGEIITAQQTVPAKGHSIGADGACSVCGYVNIDVGGGFGGNGTYTRVDENGSPNPNGDYILFGSYPQTDVTEALGTELNALINVPAFGNLPEDWYSYEYYISGEVSEFMWYKDATAADGAHYRAVYFKEYRPKTTGLESTAKNSFQDDNGYATGTVYWFKYEPIKWRILEIDNGEAFLICDSVIDAMEYNSTASTVQIDGKNIYPNNYEYSTIRKWLNENFYSTAFNELEKELIVLTSVRNDLASAGSENAADYVCNNTNDYIFLPSVEELSNSKYSFNGQYNNDATREKQVADYALIQGARLIDSDKTGAWNADWWTRSPGDLDYQNAYYVRIVNYHGVMNSNSKVHQTENGIAPALKIKINNDDNVHTHTEVAIDEEREATCTEAGITAGTKCEICGEPIKAQEVIPALGHSYGEPEFTWIGYTATAKSVCMRDNSHEEIFTATVTDEITKQPTCSEKGTRTYTASINCGGVTYTDTNIEYLNYLEHSIGLDGVCAYCGYTKPVFGASFGGDGTYTRVDENGNESESGKYVLFGTYPQSKVSGSLASELTAGIGLLPSASNSNGWTAYECYISNQAVEIMWYIDTTANDGNHYRGVYFTQYRPSYTHDASSESASWQDENGYEIKNVYWFKYEPIKWRILKEENGEALLFSELIIDSKEYYHNMDEERIIDGVVIYQNNYEYSDMRKWLNSNFIGSAFNKSEQNIIKLTRVYNDYTTSQLQYNGKYFCDDTDDYVFLLSGADATNEEYGFLNSFYGSLTNTTRKKTATDYAKCQGIYVASQEYEGAVGGSRWWLRSPDTHYDANQTMVDINGVMYRNSNLNCSIVCAVGYGVCPAITINLNSVVPPQHTHTQVALGTAKEATCTEAGITAGVKCSECGEIITPQEVIPIKGHSVGADGKCINCDYVKPVYLRVDANGNESATGEYILFGSYPQSEVLGATATDLTSLAGILPTSTVPAGWISYGYYANGVVSDYMWYKDVEYGGERYRGVYFTSYRPNRTTDATAMSDNMYIQYNSGYIKGNVYWFKYEPIKWRILEEENGEALIFSELAIDSRDFYHSKSDQNIYGLTTHANNYEHSNIRKWLNNEFYNYAFSQLEQSSILLTIVDNSAATTMDAENQYACAETYDWVFLPSRKDVLNAEYGFTTTTDWTETRYKKSTAYAKAQGCENSTNSGINGNSSWMLRSPYYNGSATVRNVNPDGCAEYGSDVISTFGGICPMLRINLNAN